MPLVDFIMFESRLQEKNTSVTALEIASQTTMRVFGRNKKISLIHVFKYSFILGSIHLYIHQVEEDSLIRLKKRESG